MAKLVLYIAASLDGFIAREDGAVDWLMKFNSEYSDFGYAEFYSTTDALVMGYKTYEAALEFGEWLYNDRDCFVLSRSDRQLKHSIRISGEINSLIRELKQKYKRIWLVGGADIIHQAIAAKCLDEMIVTFIPVILGSGIRLFNYLNKEIGLKQIETRSYPKGLVQVKYLLNV